MESILFALLSTPLLFVLIIAGFAEMIGENPESAVKFVGGLIKDVIAGIFSLFRVSGSGSNRRQS